VKTSLAPTSKKDGEKMAPKKLIAIIPLTENCPVLAFTTNLCKVLKCKYFFSSPDRFFRKKLILFADHGTIRVITEELIERRFGRIRNLFSLSNEHQRQNIWHYIIAETTKNQFVVCLAKPNPSPWVCIGSGVVTRKTLVRFLLIIL
jgi:hypothetical protein